MRESFQHQRDKPVIEMKILDLENWPRKNTFEFFNRYQTPQFNICANVTITQTLRFLEDRGINRFTAIMWLVCHTANTIRELRYRIRGENVVEHDVVHPSFTWLNDDNTLTFCMAEFHPEVDSFFNNVQDSVTGIIPNPMLADQQTMDNVLYISCLPWVNFTSISHPTKMDDTRAIPRISWGKFTQESNEWLMPVSLQLHHGLADGYHAGLFFDTLQSLLDEPNTFNWPL